MEQRSGNVFLLFDYRLYLFHFVIVVLDHFLRHFQDAQGHFRIEEAGTEGVRSHHSQGCLSLGGEMGRFRRHQLEGVLLRVLAYLKEEIN